LKHPLEVKGESTFKNRMGYEKTHMVSTKRGGLKWAPSSLEVVVGNLLSKLYNSGKRTSKRFGKDRKVKRAIAVRGVCQSGTATRGG